MSDLNYNRCSHDDMGAASAQVGVNPETGQPIELNINGVASLIAIQSALLTLSAAMKAGHEEDFLAKVALTLFGKLQTDPHAVCPLLTIISMVLMMLSGESEVAFDSKGLLIIAPPLAPFDPSDDTCMLDDIQDKDEEDDDDEL